MPTKNSNKNYRFVTLHALAWVIFIFFGTLNRVSLNPKIQIHLLDIFFTQLPSIYVFYSSNFIFFRFLSKRKYSFLVIAEILFFISYLLLIYIDGYWIAPLLHLGMTPPPFQLHHFLIECFWIFFMYSYFSFGYYFARQTIKKERELRIAEANKLQADHNTLKAEYAFLRSQINPHFLHNTLNFFYAKSLGFSKDLSDGILTLSEIMRYSLENEDSNNGKVLLTREVDNIKKVIKINQLRFSNRLNVDLSVSGDTNTVRIIPLILITLIENALKHGELTNPLYPVAIRIEVGEDDQVLYFSIFNRKKTGPKESGHGIGMDNVRKRLDRIYGENYRLNVTDEKELYTVELFVRFHEKEGTERIRKAVEC